MKPLMCALAGAGVFIALAAGPVAGQGGRPAGPPAAAQNGGGGAGMRTAGSAGSGAHAASSGGSHAAPASSSGGGSTSTYVPASSSGSSGSTPRATSWRTNPANGSSPVVRQMYGSPSDRAVPRGARPNAGMAVPAGFGTLWPHPPSPGHGHPSSPAHGPRPHVDINWYYQPWLYSGWGFYNLLFYDPFYWGYLLSPYEYDFGSYWPAAAFRVNDYSGDESAGEGALKLKVEPKDAEVYVDGYSMGTVDDFDGTFQRMALQVGPHRVEIRAPGYQTITFDVRIEPNDTITYRGQLQPLSIR